MASNGATCGSQLTPDSTCQNCGQVTESLQKNVQALNSPSPKSCQIRQGVVSDVVDAVDTQR